MLVTLYAVRNLGNKPKTISNILVRISENFIGPALLCSIFATYHNTCRKLLIPENTVILP